MKHLFRDWFHLEKRLRGARRKFLFFDFDGTLAPICPHPDKAMLDERVRAGLRTLSRREDVVLGFISGRGLKELECLVGVSPAFYSGNHGYEARGLGEETATVLPEEQRLALKDLGDVFHEVAREIPGVVVQEKLFTVSLHYRQVAPRRRPLVFRRVRRATEGLERTGRIAVKRGKMVFEICPGVQMNKGRIVRWFLQQKRADARRDVIVYVGDDRTDEDAFAVLCSAVTVCVGRKRKSNARYYLANPGEVEQLIERMVQG